MTIDKNCVGCLCTIRDGCQLAQEREAEQTRKELARLRAIEAAARPFAESMQGCVCWTRDEVEERRQLGAALAAKGQA